MPNHFREIWTEHRTNLRKHLLKREVYVAKHNNQVMISDVLYKVLQEEEQHEWTNKEIEDIIEELSKPLHTRALQKRLNQTLDDLATSLEHTQPKDTTLEPT